MAVFQVIDRQDDGFSRHLEKMYMSSEPTIIGTWIPVILRTYESYGYNSNELLDAAGVEPEILINPETRIAITVYDRLWRMAVARTGDACMGLHVISHLKPATFHALGLALLTGATIRESLNRLQRYYKIISDEVQVRVVAGKTTTALCFTPFAGRPLPTDASVDAFMAVSIAYARTLDSDRLNPAQVLFMHPPPDCTEAYEKLFRAPVKFSSEDNRIHFFSADILRPLSSANAEIALKNDQIAADYLARFDKSQIEHRVRLRVMESLGAGEPSLENIAQSIGVSSRSLNRHLANRKTSYRRILIDVRKELSQLYLKRNDMSVIEIAFRLGYADSSNFTRAFKQWFGISPSDFRNQIDLANSKW